MKHVDVKTLWLLMFFLLGAAPLYAQSYDLPVTPPTSGDLCWDSQVDYTPEETFEEFIEDVGNTTGHYTAYALITPLRQLGKMTYAAELGELIELSLRVYEPSEVPILYRVLVFIDEKPYVFEDTGLPYVELSLSNEAIIDIPLRFTPEEEGVTTLTTIFLNTESESFYLPLNIRGSSGRMSFVVGDNLPTREYTLLPLIEARTANRGSTLISLNLKEEELNFNWNSPDFYYPLPENNSLVFRILAGYAPPMIKPQNAPDPEMSKFAMIVMIDYQPVGVFDGEEVLYGQVTSDTSFAVIPVEIPAEYLKPGKQEIAVVRIANPDAPVCVLNGPPDGYWLNDSSYIARAGVEVTQP